MAAKRQTVMLLAAAFIVMALGKTTTTEADDSVCVNGCMPSCMQVEGASNADCEDACGQFCKTQGAPPWHIWSEKNKLKN